MNAGAFFSKTFHKYNHPFDTVGNIYFPKGAMGSIEFMSYILAVNTFTYFSKLNEMDSNLHN